MTTQNELVLNWLKRAPLTPLEALRQMGIMRLASRIDELRKQGHNIETVTVHSNGKRFAKYVLRQPQDVIVEICGAVRRHKY